MNENLGEFLTPDSSISVEVKSKFDAEFRRFSIVPHLVNSVGNFYNLVERLHGLQDTPFLVCYADPQGDLLPVNNDDNYRKALSTAKPLLKLHIQRKGEAWELNGFGSTLQRKKNKISQYLSTEKKMEKPRLIIGLPEDFRRVSAIVDIDIVPENHRRVKLHKHGSEKPLGFYIRDGTSVRVTELGLEKVPGIFISRLVSGGLAESTGLLAVNDEVLEVNGIETVGKTLDQVTDMMIANSANLIITVKPANQRNNLVRKAMDGSSIHSMGSVQSAENEEESDDEDIVVDVSQDSSRVNLEQQQVTEALETATTAPEVTLTTSSANGSHTNTVYTL